MPSVRPSRSCDVLYLSDHLRAADRAEVFAATGQCPFDALMEGLQSSVECFTILSDTGVPIAMFGVAPIEGCPDRGAVWMLATDELKTVTRYFLKNTPVYIAQFHRLFPILLNCVDARNTTHIRWIRWAGFSNFKLLEAYGHEQRPFYFFSNESH